MIALLIISLVVVAVAIVLGAVVGGATLERINDPADAEEYRL